MTQSKRAGAHIGLHREVTSRRIQLVTVYGTPYERIQLERAAARANMTKSRYVRKELGLDNDDPHSIDNPSAPPKPAGS